VKHDRLTRVVRRGECPAIGDEGDLFLVPMFGWAPPDDPLPCKGPDGAALDAAIAAAQQREGQRVAITRRRPPWVGESTVAALARTAGRLRMAVRMPDGAKPGRVALATPVQGDRRQRRPADRVAIYYADGTRYRRDGRDRSYLGNPFDDAAHAPEASTGYGTRGRGFPRRPQSARTKKRCSRAATRRG